VSAPPGPYTVRPATCADVGPIADVHVASWRTTYRGIVPAAHLDALTPDRWTEPWQRWLCAGAAPGPILVAADAVGRVVGFAAGGPERSGDPGHTGEVYGLYLLAEAQRQGLGRRLVRAVAAGLAVAGHRTVLIWVLAANPACGFYAALGGTPLRHQTITIGGADLDEVAYGWDDVALLTGASASALGG